jgi:hypothetical protein
MNKAYIHRIFSTPILHFSFPNHNLYRFEEREKTVRKPETWIEPLNTSFPTIDDGDSFIDVDKVTRLKNDLLETITSALKKLKLPDNICFSDFWYNIYHDNQGQEKHNHMPHIGRILPYWSGIYYNKNSSPTTFYRDYGIHKTHSFFGYESSEIADCNWDNYCANVEDGDIILFPPYLQHDVKSEERHRNNMRLTFAFNLTLNK